MFPDSPFAVPRSSFQRPVPLVLVDPDQSPTVCISINRDWIPYILGSLKQLVLQTTWRTDDPDALNLVQARAMTLISIFAQALDGGNCGGCCQEYPMSDSIFTWNPANPFTQPDVVPPGYRFPPWYVAPAITLIPGIKPGDVVTDLLHAPANPFASGFPRVRVHVTGSGTVQVKFIRFPTASIALWTVDGNIGASQWTDLHVSLEAAIGSFDPEIIIPIEVYGQGDHVIDISIIAGISEDPPFVHFGGGIRSISVCGFQDKQEPKITLIDELEYQMSICEQLRWHNGKLQALCCGEWTDISGQGDAVLGGPGQQGDGQPQPQPGGCQTYHAQFEAKGQYLVPTVVNAGDQITFSNPKGSGWDGTFGRLWDCPNGQVFFGGNCVGGVDTEGGDPAPTINHMGFIASINGVYYPAWSGTITVPGGVSNAQITIQVNDSDLADNAGSYSLDIEVCNNTAATWCHTDNLALADGGLIVYAANPSELLGTWMTGTGWVNTEGVNSSNVGRRGLILQKNVPSGTHITRVVFEVAMTLGTYDQPETAQATNSDDQSWVTRLDTAAVPGPDVPLDSGIISDTPNEIYVRLISDRLTGTTSGMSGACIVKSVTYYGTGTNPFGASNC